MSSVSREFVIQNKNLHLHWELKCCVSYTSRHKCCVSDGETERSVRCVCVDIKSALNSSFVVLLTGVWETSHHTQTHTNVWTWTVCWCLWPHDQVHIINVFTWIRPMETFGGCDTFTLTGLLHLSEGGRVNVWKPGSVVQVSRCLWKDDLDVNVGAARGPAAGYGPAARPVYFTASAPGWKL